MILIMMGLSFLCEKKILARLKQKTISKNVFCYENKQTFSIRFYISNQEFENLMDLLLVTDENKSHYVYIKNFGRFMFHRTKNKNKKYFCKSCLQCFSSKNVLTEHKEVCLSNNGAQSARLGKEITEFKNYFKQFPVSFKVYADFEPNLNGVESYEVLYSNHYQHHIPCNFARKLACTDDKYGKSMVAFRGETATFKSIEVILKEYECCKKVMKKNLIMSKEEKEQFQSSNTCWIPLMMTIKIWRSLSHNWKI